MELIRTTFSCKRKGVNCVALDVCNKQANAYVVTHESLEREFARVSDEMGILPASTTSFDPIVAGHVSVTCTISDKNGVGTYGIGEVSNGNVTEASNIAFSRAFISYLNLATEAGDCSVQSDCETVQNKRVSVDYVNDRFAVVGSATEDNKATKCKPPEQKEQIAEKEKVPEKPATVPPAAQPAPRNDVARPEPQAPVKTNNDQSNCPAQKNEHLDMIEIKFGPYRTCTIGHVFSEAMKKDPNATSYIEYVLNKQPGTAAFALLQKQFTAYAQEVHYVV